MKILNERCEWFDQEVVVCPHIAATLLDISEETLQAMVGDGIGPTTALQTDEYERDYAAGFVIFELWTWAKRAEVGPFHPYVVAERRRQIEHAKTLDAGIAARRAEGLPSIA